MTGGRIAGQEGATYDEILKYNRCIVHTGSVHDGRLQLRKQNCLTSLQELCRFLLKSRGKSHEQQVLNRKEENGKEQRQRDWTVSRPQAGRIEVLTLHFQELKFEGIARKVAIGLLIIDSKEQLLEGI